MKTRDLVRTIQQLAAESDVEWVFHSHGANHDKYTFNGKLVPIPRHREIGENLVRSIMKECRETLR